jgi:hypothetical protein
MNTTLEIFNMFKVADKRTHAPQVKYNPKKANDYTTKSWVGPDTKEKQTTVLCKKTGIIELYRAIEGQKGHQKYNNQTREWEARK